MHYFPLETAASRSAELKGLLIANPSSSTPGTVVNTILVSKILPKRLRLNPNMPLAAHSQAIENPLSILKVLFLSSLFAPLLHS